MYVFLSKFIYPKFKFYRRYNCDFFFKHTVVEDSVGPNIANQCGVTLSNLNRPENMYIRKSYISMKSEVLELLKESENNSKLLHLVINGTPQIGKSTFLSYLLGVIPIETRYSRIVVISHSSQKDAPGSSSGGNRLEIFPSVIDYNPKLANGEDIGENEYHFVRHRIWSFSPEYQAELINSHRGQGFPMLVLVDGPGCPVRLDGTHVILFASKDVGEVGSLNQLPTINSVTLYLGPWNKEEMESFRRQLPTVFPTGVTTDDLYDYFGGAIGYSTMRFAEAKKFMYISKPQRHLRQMQSQQNFSSMDLTNFEAQHFTSAFVAIYPEDDKFTTHSKKWLTIKLQRAMEYERDLIAYKLLRDAVTGTQGSTQGVNFENLFATMWASGSKTELILYQNYMNNTPWHQEYPITISFDLTYPPRVIPYTQTYFPARLGCLNRLSTNAESVDFYLAMHIPPTGAASHDRYRIYLIQTTVAGRHPTKLKTAKTYLSKIDETIKTNATRRQTLVNLGSSMSPDDQREIRTITDTNKYLEEDTGKDLTVSLTDDSVEIWFVYLQYDKNDEFDGPGTKIKEESRATDVPGQLFDKMKTVYAYLKK